MNTDVIRKIYIRITVPDCNIERSFEFHTNTPIYLVKDAAINCTGRVLIDPLNYGIYWPGSNGKEGKFLQEERLLSHYSLSTPVCNLELQYKRRNYHGTTLSTSKLKKAQTKNKVKSFIEYVRLGDIPHVTKLLDKGFDPNMHCKATGETPLTLAAKRERPRELIMTLVSGGAHVDFRSRDGHTPLHIAAMCGNYEALATFLDLGQSPNCRDQKGLTPLYYSVLYDPSPACTERLLYEHALQGIVDENGLQEIHQACRNGRNYHLELLLLHGANIDVTTRNGNTPLHISCIIGDVNCATVLLRRGANRNIRNHLGETSYDTAIQHRHTHLANLIGQFHDEDVVQIRDIPKTNPKRESIIRPPMESRSASLGRLKHNQNGGGGGGGGGTVELYPSSSATVGGGGGGGSINKVLKENDRDVVDGGGGGRRSVYLTASSEPDITDTQYLPPPPPPVEYYHHQLSTSSKSSDHPEWRASNSRTESDVSLRSYNHHNSLLSKSAHNLAIQHEQDFGETALDALSLGPSNRPSTLLFLNTPRSVVLQRGAKGFGFVLRGSIDTNRSEFQPTPEHPASQYFQNIEPGSAADRAGLKEGDFILEIDGRSVVTLSHEEVVRLIKQAGSTLPMKVVTVGIMDDTDSVASSSRPRSVINTHRTLQQTAGILRRSQHSLHNEQRYSHTSSHSVERKEKELRSATINTRAKSTILGGSADEHQNHSHRSRRSQIPPPPPARVSSILTYNRSASAVPESSGGFILQNQPSSHTNFNYKAESIVAYESDSDHPHDWPPPRFDSLPEHILSSKRSSLTKSRLSTRGSSPDRETELSFQALLKTAVEKREKSVSYHSDTVMQQHHRLTSFLPTDGGGGSAEPFHKSPVNGKLSDVNRPTTQSATTTMLVSSTTVAKPQPIHLPHQMQNISAGTAHMRSNV